MGKAFKEQKTTIKIFRDTHKRLSKIGAKGDSFDTIIKKLLDKWEDDPQQ